MSQVPPPLGMPPVEYQTPGPNKPQGLAIGALVCGILSIVLFCFWFLSVPLGIAAIVMGIIGRGKAQRGEAGGEGLAKTGMFLGIGGIALSIIATILAIAGFRAAGSAAQQMQLDAEQRIEEMERQNQTNGTLAPTTSDVP